MKIAIETSSYNERRYGNPWIAKVDFSENKKGSFAFGDWIGSKGAAGILEIEAQPGEIIAQGQKDFRKPANSAPCFYQVKDDGTLDNLGEDKAAAYKLFSERTPSNPLAQYTIEQLQAEIARRG
jgi:hypothetical protein